MCSLLSFKELFPFRRALSLMAIHSSCIPLKKIAEEHGGVFIHAVMQLDKFTPVTRDNQRDRQQQTQLKSTGGNRM